MTKDRNVGNNFVPSRSVGIATGYWLDNPGSISGRGKVFFFSMASRTDLDPTQPPIQRVLGAFSLGVKRQGHEAEHSTPSSAEVKNSGAESPLLNTS
jgi:hypothetical protein